MSALPSQEKPIILSITWSEIHRDGCLLASKIKDKKQWKKIIAVTRGGLVPAAILSRELDITLVDTICITSYNDNNDQDRLNIIKDLQDDSSDILVIDDLVDSGDTLRYIRQKLPNAFFVTLYAKPNGKNDVDAFVSEVSQNTWIVFPWEETVIEY